VNDEHTAANDGEPEERAPFCERIDAPNGLRMLQLPILLECQMMHESCRSSTVGMEEVED
jgi:hypothetical protein